jgi:hypothetical protein
MPNKKLKRHGFYLTIIWITFEQIDMVYNYKNNFCFLYYYLKILSHRILFLPEKIK